MASIIFNSVFVVVAALCLLSVSGNPVSTENDVQDAPTNREGRFYGGGIAGSQASAIASSGATGYGHGLGYPYGHGLGLAGSTSHASAQAGAGSIGFGK